MEEVAPILPTSLPIAFDPSSITHPNCYVRGLPNWDESQVLQLFSSFGDVDSVRLGSSTSGSRSSHAFVRFKDVEGARAAIQGLNGFILDGAPLTVKSADSDVVPRVQGGATPSEWCYCRGIPPSYSVQDICALFLCYGGIVDIKHFPSTEFYQGSGALVQLENLEQAGAAIQGLNGCVLPGAAQPLIVRYADSPAEKAAKVARKEKVVPRNGFPLQGQPGLAGLQEQLQLKLLELSFNQGGQALNGSSVLNPPIASAFSSGSDSLGTAEAALTAASAFHAASQGAPVGGAARGGAGGPVGQGCSLYIKGMPEDADKLWLYEKFARFGAVQSVRVLVDEHTGKCNGIGFVNYSDPIGARLAHETMNGVSMGDRLLHVMIQNNAGAGRVPVQRSFSGGLPLAPGRNGVAMNTAASQPLQW